MDDRLLALAERFRRLGCRDPEGWARSEIDEDIPQLARFVFLRELWKLVAPAGEPSGLALFAGPNDDGRGGALRRLKDRGADPDDLLTLVREAQAHVVREVAALLDGLPEPGPEAGDVRWGLFELNAALRPARPIDGLHESVDDEDVCVPGADA